MIYKEIDCEELQKELMKMDADFTLQACTEIINSYKNKELTYTLLCEIKQKFFESEVLFYIVKVLGDTAIKLYDEWFITRTSRSWDELKKLIQSNAEIFVKLNNKNWLVKWR